jgi:glycosyltransferase involved in cell wall biosynthesis
MQFEITAIITAHKEGCMLGTSLRSYLECINFAEKELNFKIEKIAMLDNANDFTKQMLGDSSSLDIQVFETEYGDQGLVRNFAVEKANGKYIAFLDGDDLWSYNWLVRAFEVCEINPGQIIAHPEYNWFFENNNNLFIHTDQESRFFNSEFLRFGNYWDSLSLTPRQIHIDHPYCERDVENGVAYEDWYWNIMTFQSGLKHKIVEDTIHFKRRRDGSQTLQASKNKTLPLNNSLFKYQ